MSARMIHRRTPTTDHVQVNLTGPQLVTLRKGLVALRYCASNVPAADIDAAIALEDDLTHASILLSQISNLQSEIPQP